MAGKVVFNKGMRTFTLRPRKDAEGNVLEVRKLLPNDSIECLDDEEFKTLTGSFRDDVVDVDKMSKPVAGMKAEYEKTIAELKQTIEELEKKLAAQAPAGDPAPEKPRKKDK